MKEQLRNSIIFPRKFTEPLSLACGAC